MLSEAQIIKNLSLDLHITLYSFLEEFIMSDKLMQVAFPANNYLPNVLSAEVD